MIRLWGIRRRSRVERLARKWDRIADKAAERKKFWHEQYAGHVLFGLVEMVPELGMKYNEAKDAEQVARDKAAALRSQL